MLGYKPSGLLIISTPEGSDITLILYWIWVLKDVSNPITGSIRSLIKFVPPQKAQA